MQWNIGSEATFLPKKDMSPLGQLCSIDCLVYMPNRPWGPTIGRYNFALSLWFLSNVGGSQDPLVEDVYYIPITYPQTTTNPSLESIMS